jgi:hypothetical protein
VTTCFSQELLFTLSAVLGKLEKLQKVTISFVVHAVAQWLRHYATNRQIAGSIPDGVIGIFQ